MTQLSSTSRTNAPRLPDRRRREEVLQVKTLYVALFCGAADAVSALSISFIAQGCHAESL
jgi:hypothetical protein